MQQQKVGCTQPAVLTVCPILFRLLVLVHFKRRSKVFLPMVENDENRIRWEAAEEMMEDTDAFLAELKASSPGVKTDSRCA